MTRRQTSKNKNPGLKMKMKMRAKDGKVIKTLKTQMMMKITNVKDKHHEEHM